MKTQLHANDRQIIEEVKRRADLLHVIGKSVRLRKQGRRWVGLCPFHQEKTPSFYVDPNEGFFKCFGCGEGGDVFSFLQQQTGQSFGEILRQLAQQVGVVLPESSTSVAKNSAQLRHVMRLASDFFIRCLASCRKEGKGPMDYLMHERGLDAKQIADYGFGFCPCDVGELLAWLRQHDVSSQFAAQAGLVQITAHGQRAFFADRITIPLRNAQGVIVGFGARVWRSQSQGPKYLNSPANDLYDKGSFLYGLPHALPVLKQGEPAVLVEGYFDVIALRSLHKAAVSACGTSLTPKQVAVLRRFTSEIVLCLDADAAGQSATKKALLLLLRHGFRVRNACLQQSDPAHLYCSGQVKQLEQQVQQAPDALEMLVRQVAAQVTVSPSQRLKRLDELLPFLSAPDRLLHVQQYTRLAAQLLGEREETLQEEIASYRKSSKLGSVPARTVQPAPAVQGWRQMDDLLLQLFLHHPQLAPQCPESILQQSHNLLQIFVRDLVSALQQQGTENPKEIFRRLNIPVDSPLGPLLIRAQQRGVLPDLQAARAILQQWEARVALIQKEQQLKNRRTRATAPDLNSETDQGRLFEDLAALQQLRQMWVKGDEKKNTRTSLLCKTNAS